MPTRQILVFLFYCTTTATSLFGQRLPVLQQIDLPHSYYYREMYLPQLTSGPSSVAWMPDAPGEPQSVIYSMQGWLWLQRIESTTAEQLTSSSGYDYQPDVSPDGKHVIFAKYSKDAIELWLLELASGKTQQLTSGGAVNLEPRWSPDGTRVAFVSTQFNRRFHIFVAQFDAAHSELKNPQRLTGETRSPLPRYYYSAFDHEISPTWSPDGREIIYISNRGHIHGTGGFWKVRVPEAGQVFQPAPVPHGPMIGPFARTQQAQPATPAPDSSTREIHYEETNWKARPAWSPDGKRVVYASYLGRSWHQLWVMTAEGGDVFQLTYGDYDNINPRWSPDGSKIAYISNRGGNLALWVRDFHSASEQQVTITKRVYTKSLKMVPLRVSVTDESGRATPARIVITAADGRDYAPNDAWIAADDSFDRSQRAFEVHYFDSPGNSEVLVPRGGVEIAVSKGLEFKPEKRTLDLRKSVITGVSIRLQPLRFSPAQSTTKWQWLSGDVHVHMNYAGAYRATPQTLLAQMQAEGLHVVQNLLVNKEQRFPDIGYAERVGKIDSAANGAFQILHGQEFHTSYWGHLGLLNIKHLIVPGYAGYPNTAAASIFPTNGDVADMAHGQGKDVLVGYVHPFDAFPDPDKDATITNELPVDVAMGKVDYYEVVGFSDHKSSAAVWYKLLNLGYRIPAAAGTDAMTNYASLRGPVGLNRVFVELPSGAWHMPQWLDGLKHGRSFVTNGPLLRFTLGGQPIGGDVKLKSSQSVRFTAALRSMVLLDHFEVVCNGEPVLKIPLKDKRDAADASGGIYLTHSGWCVLRAFADKAESPVLDIYPYATTSPIYVTVGNQPQHSPEDAKYFAAWIDRLIANAGNHSGYNSQTEKDTAMKQLEAAKKIYEAKIDKTTAH